MSYLLKHGKMHVILLYGKPNKKKEVFMMDLLYFGGDDDGLKFEKEFKEGIINEFPDAKLINAFNSIKGYRQEVHLSENKKEDYLAWIIADGWGVMSFTLQSIMIDDKKHFKKLFAMAKKQYPEKFKNVNI
jgi:hypothetical protein